MRGLRLVQDTVFAVRERVATTAIAVGEGFRQMEETLCDIWELLAARQEKDMREIRDMRQEIGQLKTFFASLSNISQSFVDNSFFRIR